MKHNEQIYINKWDVISQCLQGSRTLAYDHQALEVLAKDFISVVASIDTEEVMS